VVEQVSLIRAAAGESLHAAEQPRVVQAAVSDGVGGGHELGDDRADRQDDAGLAGGRRDDSHVLVVKGDPEARLESLVEHVLLLLLQHRRARQASAEHLECGDEVDTVGLQEDDGLRERLDVGGDDELVGGLDGLAGTVGADQDDGLPDGVEDGLGGLEVRCSPPTMMDSAAFFAPASPPETGASRMRRPRSRACFASSCVTSGRMLEKSMTRVPGLAVSKTPPGPASTSWTSGESGTMTATTSASWTASPIDAAPLPPCRTRRSTASGVRLTPMTSKPASTRWAAIGAPMMPSPTKEIVVMRLPCG